MDTLTGAVGTLSNASRPNPLPQGCHWGQPTLFLTYPVWLSAWDSPWSCGHPAHAGPLEATDTCRTCPDWTPRPRDR
jgi:hypothetical protein